MNAQRGAALAACCAMMILLVSAGGCNVGRLFGGMAQNFEYQKKIEVLPKYDGLQNRTVAVLVEADLSTLYEHPTLVATITDNVSRRIARQVPGARLLPSQVVLQWQYRTPQWNAMPYGEVAAALGVDRLVHIDLYEYRLNPPGNSWEWDGVCAANIGVIERDSYDPDSFVDTFNVESRFPDIKGVDRQSASPAAIETGVLARFVERAAWLFYAHEEPKYPDKYREPA
jgi:hypothetical protein